MFEYDESCIAAKAAPTVAPTSRTYSPLSVQGVFYCFFRVFNRSVDLILVLHDLILDFARFVHGFVKIVSNFFSTRCIVG